MKGASILNFILG